MKGNTIVVSTGRAPTGVFREVIVKTGESWYPGMIVQNDPSVALVEGVPTFKIYDRAASGDRSSGAYWVVTEELQTIQGKTLDPTLAANAIAAGERAIVYSPMRGDQVNVVFRNVSGTADDVLAGDRMIVADGIGKVSVTSGTPQTEVGVALEAITDPTADALLWIEWGPG